MKPLDKLSKTDKAKLLFELFPAEIAGLIEFIKQLTQSIIEHPTGVMAKWTDELYTTSFWVELAKNADVKLKKYEGRFSASSSLFADQLFDGHDYIFASHCLHQYLISGKCTNAKFKEAIMFLFF